MSIIYALVARGSVILAEYTNSSGNFTTVTEAILAKIPPNNSKLTYAYDRYLFHYICEDGVTYMCMADDTFGRRIPFAFLLDIKERFLAHYGRERAMVALPYGMNEFSKTIAKQMEYFSTNPNADRIKQVQGEIEQVKDVMVHNIERVLERGERIELLVDKTDNLNQQAFAFKKRSTALKRTMWWKNTKLTIILGGVVVFLIYLIICVTMSSNSTNSNIPSEDILSRKWDECISNVIVKSGIGLSVGIVASALLFKKRSWPISVSTGLGLGYALSQCERNFNPTLVPVVKKAQEKK
ncbi:Vesicle-associated membrane protein [Mortierella alpina]|nr:Vesicle-associated membrane protein [Mortierella alpina]